MRSILHPPPVDFRFEKDSYRFVALLAAVAGIGFVYTVITKVRSLWLPLFIHHYDFKIISTFFINKSVTFL